MNDPIGMVGMWMLFDPEPTDSIMTDRIMSWKRYVIMKKVEKVLRKWT